MKFGRKLSRKEKRTSLKLVKLWLTQKLDKGGKGMQVNIMDILKQNGYEVITENYMKYFRLRFTEDRKREMVEKEGNIYGFDLDGEFDVVISETGFDVEGDLYVVLESTGDEHFSPADCFDVIYLDT